MVAGLVALGWGIWSFVKGEQTGLYLMGDLYIVHDVIREMQERS